MRGTKPHVLHAASPCASTGASTRADDAGQRGLPRNARCFRRLAAGGAGRRAARDSEKERRSTEHAVFIQLERDRDWGRAPRRSVPSEDEFVPVKCNGAIRPCRARIDPQQPTRLHANFGRLKHVRHPEKKPAMKHFLRFSIISELHEA